MQVRTAISTALFILKSDNPGLNLKKKKSIFDKNFQKKAYLQHLSNTIVYAIELEC